MRFFFKYVGDESDSVYFVNAGQLKAVQSTQDQSDEVTSNVFSANSVFGDVGVVMNQPRNANIETVTPCEVYVADRSGFMTYTEPLMLDNIALKSIKCAPPKFKSAVHDSNSFARTFKSIRQDAHATKRQWKSSRMNLPVFYSLQKEKQIEKARRNRSKTIDKSPYRDTLVISLGLLRLSNKAKTALQTPRILGHRPSQPRRSSLEMIERSPYSVPAKRLSRGPRYRNSERKDIFPMQTARY